MWSIIGPIEGDTRSLGHSSCDSYRVLHLSAATFEPQEGLRIWSPGLHIWVFSQNLGPLLAMNYIRGHDNYQNGGPNFGKYPYVVRLMEEIQDHLQPPIQLQGT